MALEKRSSMKFKTKDGKKLKVIVDRDLCIGAATCVAVSPKSFELDDEVKAVILDTISEEDYQTILDAAKSCPVAAIVIEDENGKQLYP